MKKSILTLLILSSLILAGCGTVDNAAETGFKMKDEPPFTVIRDEQESTGTEETSAADKDVPVTTSASTASAEAAENETEKSTQSSGNTEQVITDNKASSSETPVTEEPPLELECVSDPKKPANGDPDCTNKAGEIIYSKYGSYNEMSYLGWTPPMGGYYFDTELETAMNDHPDGLFAIRIDVYSDDRESKKAAFLANYSDGTTTYNEVISQISALEAEYTELKNTFALSDMTEEGYAEYEEKYFEITNKLEALDNKKNEMMFAADQYYLDEEAARLAACGVIVCGYTHNMGYTNYIRATATADVIRKMPFSGNVGYLIYLDCK